MENWNIVRHIQIKQITIAIGLVGLNASQWEQLLFVLIADWILCSSDFTRATAEAQKFFCFFLEQV